MSNETAKEGGLKEASQLLKDALAALSSTTNSATSSSNNASAITEVASKIVQGSKLVQNNTQELDDYVYDTWCGIFDPVGKTPSSQQQPIIDLLLELRKTTLYPKNDASKEAIKVQGGILWSDLPTLGWVARDLWNFTPSEKSDPREVQMWTNLTAFLAKLTAISVSETPDGEPGGRDSLDFSNFALWSLRDAFEDTSGGKANANAVKIASVWIKHAGKEFKTLAEKEASLPLAQGRGGAEFAERGWTGFNDDRWAVWKAGFRAFADKKEGGSREGLATAGPDGSGDAESDEVLQMARETAGLM